MSWSTKRESLNKKKKGGGGGVTNKTIAPKEILLFELGCSSVNVHSLSHIRLPLLCRPGRRPMVPNVGPVLISVIATEYGHEAMSLTSNAVVCALGIHHQLLRTIQH